MIGSKTSGGLYLLFVASVVLTFCSSVCRAQEDPAVQPSGPAAPALDEMENDENGDATPDGWYNFRDARWIKDDGPKGPHFIRLCADKPSRPARASRAFPLDGQEYEAVVVGLWVRSKDIVPGEREGSEPRMTVDFLGDELRYTGSGRIGPLSGPSTADWVHVAKRFAIQPKTHEAILTVSLWGATGLLDFDGLSIEPVPIGGAPSRNLVVNGDAELGSPSKADYWVFDGPSERISPGHESSAAVDLVGGESTNVYIGLGTPIERFGALTIRIWAKCTNLRPGLGAQATIFYLNANGKEIGADDLFSWSGTSGWTRRQVIAPVPRGAYRGVIRIHKSDGGELLLDDLEVLSDPDAEAGLWTPFHIQTDTSDWQPTTASNEIIGDSALDVSFLLKAPAGSRGPIGVKGGRFQFGNSERRDSSGSHSCPRPRSLLRSGRWNLRTDWRGRG